MNTLETFWDKMTPYRTETVQSFCAYELGNQVRVSIAPGSQVLGFGGFRVQGFGLSGFIGRRVLEGLGV